MRYQSNRPKRRFLASVACPNCRAMDTIVQVEISEPEPDEYIECTACGHTERRPTPEQAQKMQQQDGHDGVGVVKFR
ncbi:hypothetical protein B0181_02725 [Moraxella caviae]|uniref:Probable metal-binding protein (DUF2387) n=1 Tax=Moraxella caviae TaxID=34060 RepID=A0A1T0A7E3_9GAMM|nr:YheV family putative metal-binding protein [Moraxella caviae]OOR91676.1 hypothetical protein B0181_02725 [Moraxella caviae]STZ10405.1 Probable metal-binding protein (DUF2387) [Moraxella caviae]